MSGLATFERRSVSAAGYIFAGLLLTQSLCNAAEPIITASQDDRIIVGLQGEEIMVPVPAGYARVDYRRIALKSLPVVQARKLIAAFEKRVDKSNEYQVESWANSGGPLYYLVYQPRLDYATATSKQPLAVLAEAYSAFGLETLQQGNRFAIHRPQDNSLSMTWVDLGAAQVDAPKDAPRIANCLHTAAYQQSKALLMFDTIQACGRDAAMVKTHGEAWLQRIGDVNKPSPYAAVAKAEEAMPDKGDEAAVVASEQARQASGDEGGQQSMRDRLLWLFGGAVVGILFWVAASRLRSGLSQGQSS